MRLRTSQRSLYSLMERQTGIPMGQPYSTVLISPPIIRLSSLSKSFSHSLTGSVPEAVLKNLAGRIFSESFIRMLYHIWYNMSSPELCCKSLRGMPGAYSLEQDDNLDLQLTVLVGSGCDREP